MFRFYLSSEYRKMYNQLTKLQIFNDSMAIKLAQYQQYFHHLVIIDPSITKQIQIICKEKLTYIKCIKIVIFVHTWLQSTCVVENFDSLLQFINFLFRQISHLVDKAISQRKIPQPKKMSKSAILGGQSMNTEHIQLSKQLFILQEVLPSYLCYLQKLISIFDFYNSLKKNFIKPMSPSDIWVLINLLRCFLKVSNKIPAICNFIKKSYRPIAEAITYTFMEDVNYFYPKLYKYCYNEALKQQNTFFDIESRLGEEQAFKRTIQNVQFMANLLQQVLQVNKGLKILTQEPIVQQLDNLYQPKMIDVAGDEFQMIYQLKQLKKSGYPSNIDISLATPKFLFLQSSKTLKTEEKDEDEIPASLCIFRDISNDNDHVITFRKDKGTQKTGAVKNRLEEIKEVQPNSVS